MNPPTTSCDDVREMLPLHVGGDLEEASHHAVIGHLAGCAGCRTAEARVAAVRRTLLDGLRAEVRGGGPALWPGVRAGLVGDGLLAAPRSALLRGPWRRAAAGLAAAAGIALLVAPALRERDTTSSADLVQGGSPPAGIEVVGPTVLADAAAQPVPEAARKSGLVPIRDVRDRLLQTQLGPASDPGNRLILDSPVR